MTDKAPIKLNGAMLAVLNSRFEGVVRKMANTLFRTGRSGVLNRAKDFSCCIVTADCDLLAAAESLPIHVLAGPDMMARAVLDHHTALRRGDAFINNSPYHGCSHAADQTILVPVLDSEGVHHFTVLAKAHQADIGNSIPTTYFGSAQDVYQEGALLFPAVRIQSDYCDNEDIIRMCKLRIRVPDQWYGDYLAALGAARIGEQELLKLALDVGWDTLHAFARQWFDYSENCMARALAAMPAGDVDGISTHDPFPGTPRTGIPVSVRVSNDPVAGCISIDLRENMDCLPSGLNLSEACARTAAMIGVFNSIDHSVPKNAGSFRRISVLLREGCIVGIPRHPTSCSVATTNVADRVANAVQVAIASLADGIGMAEAGAVISPATGVISGVDPRNGQSYVNQVFLGFTGGAAGCRQDGWLTVGHVGNAGLCHQDSVELAELYQPLHVYERHIMPDTEGAGMFRGAPAFLCEFGPVGASFEVGYVGDGNINGPKGARGGQTGGRAGQWLKHRNGEVLPLEACAQIVVEAGERIVSVGCGGGGYGDPRRRDPERVAADVAEGFISRERAQNIYGVKFLDGGGVDATATLHTRQQAVELS